MGGQGVFTVFERAMGRQSRYRARSIIQVPNDAVVRVTTNTICGLDLHLYEVLGPLLNEGDILGHEPMGIVETVRWRL
jgi:threonine dehydrogenase-like Zn-dependent dehydrogenase